MFDYLFFWITKKKKNVIYQGPNYKICEYKTEEDKKKIENINFFIHLKKIVNTKLIFDDDSQFYFPVI